jgi:hypothetical protein
MTVRSAVIADVLVVLPGVPLRVRELGCVQPGERCRAPQLRGPLLEAPVQQHITKWSNVYDRGSTSTRPVSMPCWKVRRSSRPLRVRARPLEFLRPVAPPFEGPAHLPGVFLFPVMPVLLRARSPKAQAKASVFSPFSPMITVQGLTLHFGRTAHVRRVSFFIGGDDRIGLVGRNGAGKSTLLKILAGQQPFDKGSIGRPKELTMGYLPQEMAHDLELTPWQVAGEGLRGGRELNGIVGAHREGPGEGHDRRRGDGPGHPAGPCPRAAERHRRCRSRHADRAHAEGHRLRGEGHAPAHERAERRLAHARRAGPHPA